MRVVSGKYKGRIIQAPTGHRTHPMSEKMRGAIFNILGDISGLTVLDAFGGSGAIAIEAVSRGAARAVSIDEDKNAFLAMSKNIRGLGLEKKVKIIKANASSWSDNNPSAQFDLIIADPPYDNVNLEILLKLPSHLIPGGHLVLSLPPSLPSTILPLKLVRQKNYGDSQLLIYAG